jgi:hypothetical protein
LGSFCISAELVNGGQWRSTSVNEGQPIFLSPPICLGVLARGGSTHLLPITGGVARFDTNRATENPEPLAAQEDKNLRRDDFSDLAVARGLYV